MSNTPASPASTLTGLEFVGHWIGETMGAGPSATDSPAHVWEIHRSNNTLMIKTRWEDEAVPSATFSFPVPRETPSFEISTDKYVFVATLVDPQHFIIRNWDTNDIRGGKGANYDVVFSRLGVAELQAQAVWRRHKDALPKARRIRKPTREQDTFQQWRDLERVLHRGIRHGKSKREFDPLSQP